MKHLFRLMGQLCPLSNNYKTKLTAIVAVMALFMCLIAAIQAPAQTGAAATMDEIQPLQIGHRIPSAIWHASLPVLNSPFASKNDTIRLSDHRGKIIVLDFWATYCSTCLKSMPKLDSIQQAFPDRFFALLVNPKVTRDDVQKIRATLAKQVIPISLPTLYEDTVLTSLFDIQGVPTLVWIDEYGTILAITNRRAISAEFVNQLITQPNNLP